MEALRDFVNAFKTFIDSFTQFIKDLVAKIREYNDTH